MDGISDGAHQGVVIEGRTYEFERVVRSSVARIASHSGDIKDQMRLAVLPGKPVPLFIVSVGSA